MKIKILDQIARKMVKPFYLLLPVNNSKSRNTTRSVIFLRPGKLGDMLVATPLFHAIKSEISDIKIIVACSSYNREIVENNHDIDILKTVNYHSIISVLRLVWWIKKNRFDVMIDLTPGFSRTTTMITFLLKKHLRTAGMHKGEYSRFFDITTDVDGCHMIERGKVLIEAALEHKFRTKFDMKVYFDDDNLKFAHKFISTIPDAQFSIAINLSAGAEERQWSLEKYKKLLGMLHAKYGTAKPILLFAYGNQNAWIDQLTTIPGVYAVPGGKLLSVIAIIKSCKILFSPDTVFIHIASALKVPVVALYFVDGENYIRWRTQGVECRELMAGVSKNVNEITAEKAFEELDGFIKVLEQNK